MKKIKNVAFIFAVIALIATLSVSAALLGGSLFDSTDLTARTDGELVSERVYNVLLLGMDSEAGLSDVIMLARVDLGGKSVSILQLPRDTYAEYTEKNYKKLNGAYATLGAQGVCDFLSKAFGISVDRYVVAGLETVCAAVDAIGGVDVDIPCDMRYHDSSQDLYIDLKAGRRHLDGKGAEQFLRFRSGYIEGDLDRMDAQKIFLAAAAKKVRDEFSLKMAYRLLDTVKGVETDFSAAELLNIAIEMSNINGDRISVATIPGAEARSSEKGASYYCISRETSAELISRMFGSDKNSFDKSEAFLNENSAAFRNIYNGSSPYKLYSFYDIADKGIEIDIK